MTPEALRRRMAHGNVYAADKIDAALANYFRRRQPHRPARARPALARRPGRRRPAAVPCPARHRPTWEARERVVVALTGGPEGETLIRRAARIAARSAGGDLLAVHVARSDGLTGADPQRLAEQRKLVESLGGTYHQVVGDDIPAALLTFARAENATQLVLGGQPPVPAVALLTGPGIGVEHDPRLRRHRRPHRHPRADGPRPAAAVAGQPVPAPQDPGVHAGRRAAAAARRCCSVCRRGQAQPDQRRAAVPARRRRGGPGRRALAGAARRDRRLARAELLLHPADPHVHDRRD